MSVKSGVYDKTVITYTYFINYENYLVKTRDVVVECFYETEEIVKALKDAGFKNVMLVDQNLNPINETSYNYVERIHVVAMKK